MFFLPVNVTEPDTFSLLTVYFSLLFCKWISILTALNCAQVLLAHAFGLLVSRTHLEGTKDELDKEIWTTNSKKAQQQLEFETNSTTNTTTDTKSGQKKVTT